MFYLPAWREGLEPCLPKKDTRYWIDPKGIFVEEIGRDTESAQTLAAHLRAGKRIVIAQRGASRTHIASVTDRFRLRMVMVVGWGMSDVPISAYDHEVWSLLLKKHRMRIEDVLDAGWKGDVRSCVDVLLRGGTLAFLPCATDGISSIDCIVLYTYKGRGI